MKILYSKYILLISVLIFLGSCTELDLQQEDAASSTTWYKEREQFRQSINEGYRRDYWPKDQTLNGISDDWIRRDALDRIKAGTLTSEDGAIASIWSQMYKAITRMLVVEEKLVEQDFLSQEDVAQFSAEINFLKASYYSYLITHFGDVPFYESELSIDESFEIPRTDKMEILSKIYEYYDVAIANLPAEYNGREYATKGAAMALKARIALYMDDFATAAETSKACVELSVYELYPDFEKLFLPSTKNSVETIFHIPSSEELDIVESGLDVQDFLPRNVGGYGARNPSWELLASFRCVDGLPIDESPLFDPQNPFKNRDPRCAMTIVPFGSLKEGDGKSPSDGFKFLEVEYNPHPEKKQVMNYNTNSLIKNNDTRSVAQYASYNGLLWKKGIDENWQDLKIDPDDIIIRYADILLMYAEAKIELGEIDDSVLDAINQVRKRAYAKSEFPVPLVNTNNQSDLRRIVRDERRMEFAFEGRRYMDLIRWKLADKAMSGKLIGMLNVVSNGDVTVPPTGPIMDRVVDPGLWFWPITPNIDEDGLPNFEEFFNQEYAGSLNIMNFPNRQYLWPIPAEERLLNGNLTQNDGY